MMFLTTTSQTPDVELQNRCLTLHVNETSEQTAAIHDRQAAKYTLAGQQQLADRKAIFTLHQNAQRLLEARCVLIPWAKELTFRHDQTRMRRDYEKYLALIASITLLHQQQRETHAGTHILATLEDIIVANRLASEALGQSLDDLLPQTRQLLVLWDDLLNVRGRETLLTQRQLRDALGWGDFQLRSHLARLVELEYALVHRTGHGNGRAYELVYDGQGRDGKRFLLGLIDTTKLIR